MGIKPLHLPHPTVIIDGILETFRELGDDIVFDCLIIINGYAKKVSSSSYS